MTKHSKKRRTFVPLKKNFEAQLRYALKPGMLQGQLAALNSIPVNEKKLLDWVRSFIQKTRGDLKALYDRYPPLFPRKVLTAVVTIKVWSLTKTDYLSDGWLDPRAPQAIRRLIKESRRFFNPKG